MCKQVHMQGMNTCTNMLAHIRAHTHAHSTPHTNTHTHAVTSLTLTKAGLFEVQWAETLWPSPKRHSTTHSALSPTHSAVLIDCSQGYNTREYKGSRLLLTSELLWGITEVPGIRLDNAAVIHQAVKVKQIIQCNTQLTHKKEKICVLGL